MQPLHSLGPSGTTSGDPAAEWRCTLPTTLPGGPGSGAATKGGSMHGSTFLVCMTRSTTCTLPHATSPRWTHGTQAPCLTTQMPGPRSGTMWVRHKDWALCSWPGTSMAGRAPALTIQQQRRHDRHAHPQRPPPGRPPRRIHLSPGKRRPQCCGILHRVPPIIVTGLESYTRCASRAHVVRLYVP